MRHLLLTVGFVAITATAAIAVESSTAKLIDEVVARKNARFVYVVPQGQFWHRYDHILTPGMLEIKPEAAVERGYSRCPECMPPRTLQELNEELSQGGPKISRYYAAYLKNRTAPNPNVPPGTLPVLDAPARSGFPAPAAPAAGGARR